MTPDPFIRDAAFKGSPILSYGTANRGSIWPKFLALGAGFFVLLLMILGSWFWFFTSIPVPDNTIVELILPAGKKNSSSSPLSWKQVHELNKPMPTVAGLAKRGETGEFVEYAIRLAPARAIIGQSNLWQLESEDDVSIAEYKSPFEVFGWPWESVYRRAILTVNLRKMFSYEGMELEVLPEIVSGELVENKWRTYLPITDLRKSLVLDETNSGGVSLKEEDSLVLNNFLRYFGFYRRSDESDVLKWEFSPSSVKLDFEGAGDLQRVLEGEGANDVELREFVMDDETVASRLYLKQSSTTASATGTDGVIEFLANRDVIDDQNVKSVSELTCSGDIMAVFDKQSLINFCSWFDICYFEYDTLVIMNEHGFLTVCGY